MLPIGQNAWTDLDHERNLCRVLGGSEVVGLLRVEKVILRQKEGERHGDGALQSETDFGALRGEFAMIRERGREGGAHELKGRRTRATAQKERKVKERRVSSTNRWASV